MSDHEFAWEWLPPPEPGEDEVVRCVRAAIASRDLLRLEHAMEAFRRHMDDLELQAAPVSVQRIEDVVREWTREDGGR